MKRYVVGAIIAAVAAAWTYGAYSYGYDKGHGQGVLDMTDALQETPSPECYAWGHGQRVPGVFGNVGGHLVCVLKP